MPFTVTIRRANVGGHIGSPKNGQIRYVQLTNDVIEKLKILNRDSDIIFHRSGKRLIYWPSLCFLQRACKRANIEPIGWHTLRYTFASQLASKVWATGGQRYIPTAPINLETLFATAFNTPLNHTKKPQSS